MRSVCSFGFVFRPFIPLLSWFISRSPGALAHLSMDTVMGMPSSKFVTVSLVGFNTLYGPVILNRNFDWAMFLSLGVVFLPPLLVV